jgi:hypothetical protein
VTLTAGTARQLAGIDPEAWRNPLVSQRYALLDHDEHVPQLRRALGAAGRAAAQGKHYRKKINGSDVGDVELTVTPQPGGASTVTVTVQPYADTGAAEDREALTEADFDTAPDEIEDDDGTRRPPTAEERAAFQADIRADYEQYLAEHPLPQPLVVNLSPPMVDELRHRLAARQAGTP